MSPRVVAAKQQLMLLGLMIKSAMDYGMERAEAFKFSSMIMIESMEVEGVRPPMYMVQKDGRLHDPITAFGVGFALAWLECGFPELEPSHKLAASLMCTSVAPDYAAEIPMPWRCFAISVPSGLLDGSDAMTAPELILVLRRHDGSAILTMELSAGSFNLAEEPNMGGYAEVELQEPENISVWEGDHDLVKRRALLIGRLVVGCCIEANKYRPSSGQSTSSVRMKRGEPKSWVIKLQRAVNLDVRDYVRSYAAGRTDRKVGVQIVVRGHHKWQPCGPDSIGRKWIHIEPYWRGPEDAPILAHPRKMGS